MVVGDAALGELRLDIERLIESLVAVTAAHVDEADAVHPRHRRSAANLLQYVSMREHDIRGLQVRLARAGLSSLGRSESHVLAAVEAVRDALHGWSVAPADGDGAPPIAFGEGERMLDDNADELLGPTNAGRRTRIMVTLGTEAAFDPALIDGLVERGVELIRINCAHDDVDVWAAMIEHVRAAARHHGAVVRVMMDLAGPKLRTGPLEPGPSVLRLRPERDAIGRTIRPAMVWLGSALDDPVAPVVPVRDPRFCSRLDPGDLVSLRDARGSRRQLRVVMCHERGCLASADDTCYLVPGLSLRGRAGEETEIADLEPTVSALRVRVDDTLVVTRSLVPAPVGSMPPRIGCTLAGVFDDVRPGDRIMFDDGKIGGVIASTSPEALVVSVTQASAGGSRLRAEKGINLPDTALSVAAFSAADDAVLPFVVQNADIVGASFVRNADDVRALQRRLRDLDGERLGVMLKIETAAGFRNLPSILLAAMQTPRFGVMIARGDLAVEVGYERLAEVQEEMLWLCEAAHVPVTWATQVLDSLAHLGRPSRAEVTDAAMAERAECVMLNKGPFIFDAVTVLSDILGRMAEHQHKKRTLLRRLTTWDVDQAVADPVTTSRV